MKSASALPVGCAVSAADLDDAALVGLVKQHFSQVTPASQMKMGVILDSRGRCHFDAAERLVGFAAANGMRVHGHTLVWYKVEPAYFAAKAEDRRSFRAAYREYIATVASQFRGRVSGWDVVNEPILGDGTGLRDSLWSRALGAEDYIALAFEQMAASDPDAVAFINEYGLEARPAKRLAYMRLIERLLKRGVPITGIGTQTHIAVDLRAGAAAETIRDLASFGLPIHVSELDITLGRGKPGTDQARQLQAERAAEVVEAYMRLPSSQRYAITLWGVRDRDSWLRLPPYDPQSDEPLAFDDDGQPKPMLPAMIDALANGA